MTWSNIASERMQRRFSALRTQRKEKRHRPPFIPPEAKNRL